MQALTEVELPELDSEAPCYPWHHLAKSILSVLRRLICSVEQSKECIHVVRKCLELKVRAVLAFKVIGQASTRLLQYLVDLLEYCLLQSTWQVGLVFAYLALGSCAPAGVNAMQLQGSAAA